MPRFAICDRDGEIAVDLSNVCGFSWDYRFSQYNLMERTMSNRMVTPQVTRAIRKTVRAALWDRG